MNKIIPSRRRIRFWKILSLVSLILGIGIILWSLYSIETGSSQVKEQLTLTQKEITYESPAGEESVTPSTQRRAVDEEGSMAEGSPKVLYPIRPSKGERIGILKLPTIGKTLPIIHGTDEDELEKGVGHYAKSVLPGEPDNSVLSGHRDTVFRQLGEIKEGDPLIVETSAGIFTYQVNEIRIVDRDDKTIIVPADHAVLTVSTCYPFDFIGDAPKRYILISDLVKSKKK
jgi:sortase A